MNVVALPTTTKPTKSRARGVSRKTIRLRRQRLAAVGLGFVAATLTALSLSHLAHGIQIVTGTDQAWEAWAMAIGVDLGFVALELAQIAITTKTLEKRVARYTKPAIAGTIIGSALMNAFAFAAQASGYMAVAAVALGVAIPTLVYALTRIGATMYIDGSN